MHCKACDQVYFCSNACADAYLPHHQSTWICTALRKLASLKKVGRHERSIAQLVLLVHWQRSCELAPFDTNHDQVDALESHYLDWDDSLKEDYRRVLTFLESQLPEQSSLDIMHLVSRIESNAFGVHVLNKKEPVGRALFPVVSLFNHDCDCNCEAEQILHTDGIEDEMQKQSTENPDGTVSTCMVYPDVFTRPRGLYRVMEIRTLRHADPDVPLTISYVDTSLPVAARRKKLLEDYFFECTCTRCESELVAGRKVSKKKNKK
ncbi:hypothetical protein LRAMOSA05543 [Lichtheimia ramosa]|uniref:Uncharacterized protein n=1 Tax=Lichtheimia ramosa TaxID=688394 RepID=A0A077X191_9FUNG|nr:hypothetical protein LRAMOSA05543 [Lichtheimia ramosa]